MWDGRLPDDLLTAGYQPPTRLPARGRIEVIRYIRSNRQLTLFGKRITLAEDQTHQYVTAIIKVRAKRVIEIIHDGAYDGARTLQ